ncbi:hypothetical protein [Desertivirga brevis]|uniref:hypothetical protein n=1 Tax=Desertivirga brevis TaxID=2810310 RepID=UPI001A958CCF|nr:hypothetical protein [Pedobacter sp. SYSU D00873]
MRTKILLLAILLFPLLYISFCNQKKTPKNNSSAFPLSLKDYGLFDGPIKRLQPSRNVFSYQLSSALFTDYTEKQRLIRLPRGKMIQVDKSSALSFPEGTIIAKTFYYPKSGKEGRIMETRILERINGSWAAATYKWNESQDDARLVTKGENVPVTFKDTKDREWKTAYRIPSTKDCGTCHQKSGTMVTIGPELANLNRMVAGKDGKPVNQLQIMQALGFLKLGKGSKIAEGLPAYFDNKNSLEKRARAYLKINCAHCHNPGGFASAQTISLDYSTTLSASGLLLHRKPIPERMKIMGQYHMPKLGTTLPDVEGIDLIEEYLKSLP